MKKLEFGTAGIRGKIGKGEENLNFAHVQRIAHGYSKYLLAKYPNQLIKVVIGRDNRHKSYSFAQCCATILDSYGINVIFSKDISPTPFVSFAIMHYQAHGGINITASHNPKEYNGIKIYNNLAMQCLPDEMDEMISYFEPYANYSESFKLQKSIKKSDYKNLEFISKKVIDKYINAVALVGEQNGDNNLFPSDIKIAYTPLHGTGNKFVPKLFNILFSKNDKKHCENVFYVKEQMKQDSRFSSCIFPNPEKKQAYELVIKLGKKVDADILLMTDPDSDRVGLAVKHNNEYQLLNGNETAIIITKFLLDTFRIENTNNYYLVYSYVSTNVPEILASKKGIESFVVPTGFKWIGMTIDQQKQENRKCLFAFEESYGSLINEDLSRDKDALQSISILAKMASYYKKQGKTLVDLLNEVYDEAGYVSSENVEITIDPNTNLKNLQEKFKNIDLDNKVVVDFNLKNNFLKSNMIQIKFENDNSWLALRPSGTEPKIKFYIFAFDKTAELSKKKLDSFKNKINEIIN
ncbi:phospho-sugar mutase [Mycoplasmopsis primatum]|uniref:phospho-sugar mutase n=1 Tax=Mycoplasmopsis primatum TaxID=55604 RepID=UPI0004958464|nr:phospho-sugar mutase [Mycoplasmopsis primatum]